MDSFFLAGPGNRGGLSPVFRPRLRPAEKTGTVTVYSSPGARIPRAPPRRAKGTGPSHEIPAAANPWEESRALSLAPKLGSPFSSPFKVWGTPTLRKAADRNVRPPALPYYSENRPLCRNAAVSAARAGRMPALRSCPATTGQGNRPKPRDPCRGKSGGQECPPSSPALL